MKLKWLFISLLIVYALGTPGEYILNSNIAYLPTKEGLLLGLTQISRLVIALATLTILFSKSSVETLVSGLHILLYPLRYLKCNSSQFAVRLLLTLQYADALMEQKNTHKKQLNLLHLLQIDDSAIELNTITLKEVSFSIFDYLLLMCIAIYLLALLRWL